MTNRQHLLLLGIGTLAVGMFIVACAGDNSASPAPGSAALQPRPTSAPTATAAVGFLLPVVATPVAASAPAAATPAGPTPRPPVRSPVTVPGAMPGETTITITGQVKDVAASAQVIDLVEPVHGIAVVAVDEKTEVTSADGERKALQDVQPGVVIQASGGADGNGAVLATTIRILTGPSPLPQ